MSTDPKMRQNLALFDLDHTLIPTDSDVLWAQELVHLGLVDAEWHSRRNDYFFEQYKQGTLDIQEFLTFQLAPLAAHARQQLEAWRAEFVRTRVLPKVLPQARALVDEHRAAGDLLVLVTATNAFVTRPIADLFEIPHLIATELETHPNGEYTGRPLGMPSFREGKVVRLMQWLAERGQQLEDFEQVSFYSDSLNDLPLLQRVNRPVATNPDATLRAHAQACGWTILDLFDQAH